MRIGLSLPHYDFSFPGGEPLSWPALLDAARRAEDLGFDSIWISDHFFLDLARYGGPDRPFGSVEPFSALAALAPLTRRVRLGTLVACTAFRHPAIVAKQATAIDLASGGRFDLGIGAGWYEREFRAFGYPYPGPGERFRMLEEHVQAIAALFAGGPADVEGRYVTLRGALNRPLPATPEGPPIWIGGKGGDRLLRLVARHGAGWNTVWKWTPQAYGERIEALVRICRAEGRDPATVRRSVGLSTLVGRDRADLEDRYEALRRWTPGGALDAVALDDWARDTLTGTPEACLDRLRAFAALGVEEVIVAPASLPFAVYDWSEVELVAEALVPAAHELAAPAAPGR